MEEPVVCDGYGRIEESPLGGLGVVKGSAKGSAKSRNRWFPFSTIDFDSQQEKKG